MDLEQEIRTELKPLIEKWKKKIYVAEYVKGITDAEALGVIMSKYLEWTGTPIFKAIESALEDANFHHLNEKFLELVEADDVENPVKKFKLEITLGNDSMRTSEDISSTLLRVAENINYRPLEERRNVKDLNGNTVGFYEVAE